MVSSKLKDYPGDNDGPDMTIMVNFVNCTVAQSDVRMPVMDDLEF